MTSKKYEFEHDIKLDVETRANRVEAEALSMDEREWY